MAASYAPNRGIQGHPVVIVDMDSPARIIVGNQAQVDQVSAPARTKEGSSPRRTALVSDQIDGLWGKTIRNIFRILANPISSPKEDSEPVYEVAQPVHAASPTLSSGMSSNGATSPRPMCRAKSEQGSLSPTCS